MDTTRENVERWIAEHAKPHITRDYRPADEARDMLRALVVREAALNQVNKSLNAERDTLKALCVELVAHLNWWMPDETLVTDAEDAKWDESVKLIQRAEGILK